MPEKKEWGKSKEDTVAALFKQGDKEFAKESNKKHINKGSAGVRKGYNPNTNAFRQRRDEETGELSKKQEIRHDDLDNSLMDEDYYKFKSTSSKP